MRHYEIPCLDHLVHVACSGEVTIRRAPPFPVADEAPNQATLDRTTRLVPESLLNTTRRRPWRRGTLLLALVLASVLFGYWLALFARGTEPCIAGELPPVLAVGDTAAVVPGRFHPATSRCAPASPEDYVWSSSDSTVLAVTRSGSVLAVSPGAAMVTGLRNGNRLQTATHVFPRETTLTFQPSRDTLAVGDTTTLGLFGVREGAPPAPLTFRPRLVAFDAADPEGSPPVPVAWQVGEHGGPGYRFVGARPGELVVLAPPLGGRRAEARLVVVDTVPATGPDPSEED